MTELEKELTEINEQLRHQIQILILEERIQVLMKKMFGTSSEKNPKVGAGQPSIFDTDSPFFPSQRQLKNENVIVVAKK